MAFEKPHSMIVLGIYRNLLVHAISKFDLEIAWKILGEGKKQIPFSFILNTGTGQDKVGHIKLFQSQ